MGGKACSHHSKSSAANQKQSLLYYNQLIDEHTTEPCNMDDPGSEAVSDLSAGAADPSSSVDSSDRRDARARSLVAAVQRVGKDWQGVRLQGFTALTGGGEDPPPFFGVFGSRLFFFAAAAAARHGFVVVVVAAAGGARTAAAPGGRFCVFLWRPGSLRDGALELQRLLLPLFFDFAFLPMFSSYPWGGSP